MTTPTAQVTDEMLDKIAQAIAASDPYELAWHELLQATHDDYRRYARAAIEAMSSLDNREATPTVTERDEPDAFEAWWQNHPNKNRELANYSIKKQIAWDAWWARTCAIQATDEGLRSALRRIGFPEDNERSLMPSEMRMIAQEALGMRG